MFLIALPTFSETIKPMHAWTNRHLEEAELNSEGQVPATLQTACSMNRLAQISAPFRNCFLGNALSS